MGGLRPDFGPVRRPIHGAQRPPTPTRHTQRRVCRPESERSRFIHGARSLVAVAERPAGPVNSRAGARGDLLRTTPPRLRQSPRPGDLSLHRHFLDPAACTASERDPGAARSAALRDSFTASRPAQLTSRPASSPARSRPLS